MRPGSSTEPIWKVRLKVEWNTAEDGLDVWVIEEEWDTDGSWLGMRVLRHDGQWGEWITASGASGSPAVFLGTPTQTLRGGDVRGIALLPSMPPVGKPPAVGGSAPVGPSPMLKALSTKPAPAPSKLTPEALESMRKAIEKASAERGTSMVMSPAVREYMKELEFEYAIELEKEFLYGKKAE